MDCKVKSSNFSLIKVNNVKFNEVEFNSSKLVGIKWFKASTSLGFNVSFDECILDYGNFADLDLKKTEFIKSSLKEVYFTENNLTKSVFTGSDLTGTIFHNCDLTKSDFRKVINYKIDFTSNKLTKAKFSLPEAISLLESLDMDVEWEGM